MAIIQTIRDKYAKVMFFVIVLALLGFILMYATNDVGRMFGNNSTVGTINGTDIDYKEYEAAVQQREDMIKQQYQMQSLDENMQARVRDEVWQNMVNDKLMQDIEDKLNITVTQAEVNDMIGGPHPDPFFQQQLVAPGQQYDAQQIMSAIKQIERSNSKDERMVKQKEMWLQLKNEGINERLKNKFNAMITGAIYTPKAMLDAINTDRNTYAGIQYVMLPYTLVNDNDVKVSDDEIKKYMEAHKAMFEQPEPSRSIDYVTFNIIPSAADSAKVLNSLDTLKAGFAQAADGEAFASRNSENQIPAIYQTKQTLQGLPNVDELLNAPAGTVVGPFLSQGNSYMMAKVLDKTAFPDSVAVRHILVQTEDPRSQQLIRQDTTAKTRMDSVVAMLNSGVPFDSLVVKYSDDKGSAEKGGLITATLSQRAGLAKEFGDFMFEGKQGEHKVVKTVFGYHYIEILYQGAPESSSKIAFISKQLSPSDETYQTISSNASAFDNKVAASPASFDKEAQAAGVMKQQANGLNENSSMVGQLGASRELVRWAYSAKKGDVSPTFTMGEKLVVAKLTDIQEAGLINITDQNRPGLARFVSASKKAKILADRNKGKSLDAIATGENQQVITDDSVTFLRAKSAISQEPKALGYAFYPGLNTNTLSPAITGNNSVVFLTVGNRTTTPQQGERNPNMEQQMSNMAVKNSAVNNVLQAIKEKAKVKDRRGKVYQ